MPLNLGVSVSISIDTFYESTIFVAAAPRVYSVGIYCSGRLLLPLLLFFLLPQGGALRIPLKNKAVLAAAVQAESGRVAAEGRHTAVMTH